ncbi:MAG: 2Fe-2S iron-sulfur cluster binding domain-containing protein [Syntrophomonadaceae bacterium]|jgi:bidirectional [NiFe] hydrogenase diaphorase subunit|nr:2Fe-2S iron-sulfur cluster binding domain-containing protein [Syntrophomonadaceae bacterium]
MKIIIDGQRIETDGGETILEIARRNNIAIPTLCYHEALGGQGHCRLCLVELSENGITRLVASCTYPVTSKIVVRTSTPRLEKIRSTITMLLYKQAQGSELMQKLANEYNCPENSLVGNPAERCILCRLCVDTCAQLGTSAISTAGRGIDQRIATPYDKASTACLGCSACANVCPTDAIPVYEDGEHRFMWNKEFELIRCDYCGQPFATREELNHISSRTGEQAVDTRCGNCKKKGMAWNMRGLTLAKILASEFER